MSIASVLVAIGTLLAYWCAASILSVPVLVACVRAQQRANARRTVSLCRGEWMRSAAR
jgi:hypothetical protein